MKLSLVIPTRRDKIDCLKSINKYTKDYEIVLAKDKKGFVENLNDGIRRAKGDYIILLHDDCEVTKGWTDELAEVGAFKLGEYNDSFNNWGGFVDPPAYCTSPFENPDYAYWLCLSRKVVKKIGEFDKKFTKPFYQDVDMGLHIKKKGFKIECLSGKIIHNNGEGSGVPDEGQRLYLNKKWSISL
jgi:O-antigen biosynthesis protein